MNFDENSSYARHNQQGRCKANAATADGTISRLSELPFQANRGPTLRPFLPKTYYRCTASFSASTPTRCNARQEPFLFPGDKVPITIIDLQYHKSLASIFLGALAVEIGSVSDDQARSRCSYSSFAVRFRWSLQSLDPGLRQQYGPELCQMQQPRSSPLESTGIATTLTERARTRCLFNFKLTSTSCTTLQLTVL